MKTRTFIAAGCAVHARTIATPWHLRFRRAWLWTGFLAFAAIVFGPRPAQAAVTEAWVHRFTNLVNSTTDEAVKVVHDAAGDIIVTGRTGGAFFLGGDMLTIKYSGADGSVLWQQRYNGPANGDDGPSALAVDGSGNVVVTGSSELDPASNGYEAYTAKYAATDGALLWERRDRDIAYPGSMAVDGSGNVVVTGSDSIVSYTAKYAAADGALLWEKRYGAATYSTAMAVDGSDNVVVTGNSFSNPWDVYTAKLAAADGALLWEKFYGPSNSLDRVVAVAVDGGGNVVVTGVSLEWLRPDYYTAKYAAADGALLWEQRYDYSDDEARALAVDASGNVVVTGSSGGDYYTAKYAATDGALLWEKRYNGPANGNDYATAVAVDGSGNVVVTGSSGSDSFIIEGDYYTAKYAAADGALLWEKRYNGPANSDDSANAVVVDGSGNVVVAGRTDAVWAMGTVGGDSYTAKYAAANGALLWEKRYTGLTPNYASAQAVAVDGSGNVVVTGIAYNRNAFDISDGDYYTAKYAAASGALLWEKRYNGPPNGDDSASALAVDASGNVVVTGISPNTNSVDYYTAKYAAADGALLWEKRYNGPANRDYATAVAVDASGNVVVTGRSERESGSGAYEIYTAKYAATDGALLWERRGPVSYLPFPANLAVDASGNVVVTGTTYGTNSMSDDYYTAKYAAADGALLWEKRYNGPANHDDRPSALAVDGSGNVVVTGISFNSSTNHGCYTAKYAAADGALLWEKLYNDRANTSASALAVDGSGNVVVTGGSGWATGRDYYTAKYAAADGALLWEKLYNGTANGYDQASAVAVDGSGNVVVTGSSASGGDSLGNSIFDYYTAKYASADGALIWEKRLTSASKPDFELNSPHRLALGSNGMVAVTGTSYGGYATFVYREVPEVVSINLVSAGIRLRFSGVSGRGYNIERAPAVSGPWSTINTQTASASGLFEYLDTNSPPAAAFYRTSEP